MSIAETTSEPTSRMPTARILQFKQALHDKTAAMGGWASERAGAVRETAAGRPLATAGISAGAAFVGGLALGLLLAGRMGALKSHAMPFARQARSFLKL